MIIYVQKGVFLDATEPKARSSNLLRCTSKPHSVIAVGFCFLVRRRVELLCNEEAVGTEGRAARLKSIDNAF